MFLHLAQVEKGKHGINRSGQQVQGMQICDYRYVWMTHQKADGGTIQDSAQQIQKVNHANDDQLVFHQPLENSLKL